ncbi:MAG: hypothetical protein GTN40_03135, partial [Candidatus Aenigmarchaeota archaeon]|nr:hypothetical protein [Candidatus Aenigmarchaeota archaeon]
MTYFKSEKKQNFAIKFLCFCFAFLLTLTLLVSSFLVRIQNSFGATQTGKLAVTPSGYDDIGEVLEKLGFQADEIQEEDLASGSTLSSYDAVYINCSSSIDSYVEDAATIVRDYVKNGGIIYASDYTNALMDAAFPGKINFYKSSGSLDSVNAARVGNSGEVEADVTDSGLAAVLGKTKIKVNYDLGSWAVIDSVGSGVQVLMKGSVPITDFNFDSLQDSENLDLNNLTKTLENKPLVVTFSEGKGQVLYTTFHNEAQKTSDTESVLNWFAVRAKAGKLSQAVQELITKDGNEVLQEIVDSINQGETKKYLFGASGEADFQIILNFGGSKLSLKITDPNGKEVASQTVSSPPYTKSIDATKGNYEIEIKGVEVPEKNYPFVVAVGGPEEAMV